MKLDIEITKKQRELLYSHVRQECFHAVRHLDEVNKWIQSRDIKGPIPEHVKRHVDEAENRVSLWIEVLSKLEANT